MTAPRLNPPIYDLESPLRAGRPVLFLVVHTAECAEVDGNDDAVSRYLARMSNSSIHASIDNNSITPSVPENRVAWAASNPKINNFALQAEWIGRADQGTHGWDDAFSRDQMKVGAWLYARWAREHNIPVRHGTVEDLRAGRPGFYGHIDSTRAWSNADGHYDPGPTFPWERFLGMVRDELAEVSPRQLKEDDMYHLIIDARPGQMSGWLVHGFKRRWMPNTAYLDLMVYAAKNNPAYFVNHGMQAGGSEWIALLDFCEQVGAGPESLKS